MRDSGNITVKQQAFLVGGSSFKDNLGEQQ